MSRPSIGLREYAQLLESVRAAALRDFRALMRLPPSARRAKLKRAITRFRNPVLADLLLEESKQQVTRDPKAALELAECSLDAAQRVPEKTFGRSWAMTVLARAHAYRGNALRVLGELRKAHEALRFALETFDREGNGDPYVEAEILSLLASASMDQRSFIEAEAYIDMARGLYAKLGETALSNQQLMKKSMLFFNAGDFDRALEVGFTVLQGIDPEADPRLYLAAEHNYTAFLAEVGRSWEALERLENNAERYDLFPDSWTQLRREKLRGNILRELGSRREAERALLAVRSGFMCEGLELNAAIASLDLAHLYLEEGKTREVKHLAEEIVPVFHAQGVQPETAAAVFLYKQAARWES